ncbi:MAG: phosphosulfolactate synthase, partial [Geminicoccaceae bacterium]
GKPRDKGLTIVRDRIRPLAQQRHFLDTYAPFVDLAKLSNISAAFYPETLIDQKLELYRQHDVTPMFGGIVFENAFVRDKVDEFVAYAAAKGAAVEISDNIASVPMNARLSVIRRLHDAGLQVLCEVGEKYPKQPLDVDRTAEEIEELCENGVKLVVLERGEIDVLLGEDGMAPAAGRLIELFERVGHERLMAEVETKKHMLHMIQAFGQDVNLGPNVDWELVPWLEPARHGVGREIGHKTIEQAAEKGQIRSRRE